MIKQLILGTICLVLPFVVYAECDSNEVGYVATFKAKPGSEKEFEAVLSKLANTVKRVEPGAIFYAPYKGTDGTYYMMERYTDEAARKAHGSHADVAAIFPALGPLLAAPPDVQPVSAICAG
jgi:quinol monooxygenase YgiN